MKKFKSFWIIGSIVIMTLILMSMNLIQPVKGKPWDIPANYKNMPNGVKSTDASIQAGALIYKKNCAACHGKTGLGDGPKAKTLETFSGDFTSAEFQKFSDGAIFYQIKVGRDEMPKYDKKIEDEDIWNSINYIRTFKK